MHFINIFVMVATIGFGLIGWLLPKRTMKMLGLSTVGKRLGISEIRAVNGALFVGLGVGAIALSEPIAFAVVGFAYAGAALGRLTSIVIDRSGTAASWCFFSVEAVFGGFLVFANL